MNLQYQDVVQICIQYKLLTLLAFVCPDEDDYLTPIVNLYATKQDHWDGYRCLWYLDYCFKKNKGVKDLMQWLTSTDALQYFLSLNYSQTLVSLLHLFRYPQS